MNTTTTDWRDLTDQLTPHQIAQVEQLEHASAGWPLQPGDDASPDEKLVRCARSFIRENLAQIQFADIVVPADAIDSPSAWAEWEEGVWNRHYTAAWSTPCDETAVEISCWQYSDGRADERHVYITTEAQLDSAAARAVAAALLAAADKLDQLTGEQPPFM